MPDDDPYELEAYWQTLRRIEPPGEEATLGSLYGPAMDATSQEEADRRFGILVEHTMKFGKTQQEAEGIVRSNLGYYAGYHSNEVRERVERLYRCAHPVFGPIAERGPPTPEEVSQAGMRMEEEMARRRMAEETSRQRTRERSAVFCEHAKEMPQRCPCPPDCYCKEHSCRDRR